MVKPTDAELDAIKDHLFLFKPDAETRLALPAHDPLLDPKYERLKSSFFDLSFAIIEYGDFVAPKAFLHDPDQNWDVGTCGMLSIAVAALALLKDIRTLSDLGLIPEASDPATLDDLFRYVWTRHSDAQIRQLAIGPQYPLPSKVINFATVPPDLQGSRFIDFDPLHDLTRNGTTVREIEATSFRELLHLVTGDLDERAARACQGALGIGFINAVLTKLGLFDESSGQGVRIAGDYFPARGDLPAGWRQPKATEFAWARSSHLGKIRRHPHVGTARTLAALMQGIMEFTLLDPTLSAEFRDLLLVRAGFSLSSFALTGIRNVAPAPPTQVFSKIGFGYGITEFLHVETAAGRYSLIILGLIDKGKATSPTKARRRAVDLAEDVQARF